MAEKIYDYFKTDPIILNGKFARYADDMWVQNRIEDKSRLCAQTRASSLAGGMPVW